ncbi:MFS transporter [Natronolimnohabitans innermongolicus]|uniref:MFS transporter n=1 Tax=Natronolimnohabitans innermongolicus TaxID=253107 RepID=UPI001F4C6554|nr:MFS transporter [Natronolimnohabitans innermongolicus]
MIPDPRRVIARRVYYGWVIVAGCLAMSMVVFGTSYAFGVFYDAFAAEFDVSRSVLALAFGIQTVFIYVVGLAAGWLVDRYGQRRIVACSTVILTAGLVWTAFARSYVELVAAFGVVTAVGMSGLYVVAYATIPLWFERRRGTAAGIASAGLGVGLFLIPQTADVFISALGWREAMLAIAAGVGTTMLVVTLLFVDEPEAVAAETSDEFADAAARADGLADRPSNSRAIIASPSFGFVFVGWVLLFTPVFVVLTHVVLYASAIGISRSVGVAAIAIVGATTTITRLGIGTASDRLGRTRTFLGCSGLMALVTAGMGGLGLLESASVRTAAFVLLIVCFGFAYGGCGGLISAQVADLFGNRNLNTLFAAMSVSFAVSGLLAPPLAGLSFDVLGSYTPAFVAAGLCAALGTGCVYGAARRIAGPSA